MSKRKWNFMNNSTRRVDMSLPIQVQSRLYHFKSHILALVAAHVLAWLWSPVFSASPVPPLTHTAIKPSRGVWHPLIARPVSTAPPNLHSFSHDRSRKVSLMYTYCMSRRNFFDGKQLRVRSWSNRATRCALIGGALGDTWRACGTHTTPPSTARAARRARAAASRPASTADPKGFHQ